MIRGGSPPPFSTALEIRISGSSSRITPNYQVRLFRPRRLRGVYSSRMRRATIPREENRAFRWSTSALQSDFRAPTRPARALTFVAFLRCATRGHKFGDILHRAGKNERNVRVPGVAWGVAWNNAFPGKSRALGLRASSFQTRAPSCRE